MSNVLVMRGADFSEQSVEQIDFFEYDVLSVEWTEGKTISKDGTLIDNVNHKRTNPFNIEGYISMDLRCFGSADYAIVEFKNENDDVIGIVTKTESSGTLVNVPIPSTAVKAQVAYIKDSRCATLEIPTLIRIKCYRIS